uniref:Uncharacterized protein AlNc14C400G11362 n=1 Tax=Albugo laibachii Nc14 TaxID=890382 RepID=F0WYV2_9STRA|nr:conserved hypothetical protein [Albugo laibachii Nc14]|eukprot:CCA26661.1 conserved hypothetical protein [Albugo laibachii Nc14]
MVPPQAPSFTMEQELENIVKIATAEARVQRSVWVIAGLCVATSIIVSVRLIRAHLRNFTKPATQSKIVGILWMVPIYATDSWLSLRFKNIAVYLDLMRDCYEAYVIYLFLALMIAYLGDGNHERVLQILQSLPSVKHFWPVNNWKKPELMAPEFLRDCKIATMQFVVMKPLMALIAIILQVNDAYDQGQFRLDKGYIYVSFLINLSVTYAFYYLVLFYYALEIPLRPYNPVLKLLCIKAVIFLSFWQSVVLAFLSRFRIIHELGSWSVENVTTGIQNLLICFEMTLVAIAHTRAFPYEDFVPEHGSPTMRTSFLADHLAFESAMQDFNEVMPIVLPTSFKPGGSSIYKGAQNLRDWSTHWPRNHDVFESEPLCDRKHLGSDKSIRYATGQEKLDAKTRQRGWKL